MNEGSYLRTLRTHDSYILKTLHKNPLLTLYSLRVRKQKLLKQNASWQCNKEKMQGRARLVELIFRTLRRLLRKS